jgi:argininosuccinate lyase
VALRVVAVPALGPEVGEVLEQRSWLESKVSEGGTALARVREQLAAARAALTA